MEGLTCTSGVQQPSAQKAEGKSKERERGSRVQSEHLPVLSGGSPTYGTVLPTPWGGWYCHGPGSQCGDKRQTTAS